MKLFYRGKYLRKEEKNSSVSLYTTLLSMVLCAVCLAGTSWAWFTANQALPVAPIASAEWALDTVQVYQVVSDVTAMEDGDISHVPVDITVTKAGATFTAAANTRYLVTATAKGTATVGFVQITTCDGTFYNTSAQSSFTLLLSQNSTVTVTASWGSGTGNAQFFESGAVLGSGVQYELEG